MITADGYGLGWPSQRGGADRVGEEELGRGEIQVCILRCPLSCSMRLGPCAGPKTPPPCTVNSAPIYC